MLEIYQPEVEFFPIYVPKANMQPCLRYNHDVDIVKFKDKYFAGWNANELPKEGVSGQYNFLSISDDFQTWTSPIKLFSSEENCQNPVKCDNQWQPSFINFKDEKLFCAWCDMLTRRVFVSESTDGVHWKNKEVKNVPDVLAHDETGFPTNHGLITSKGVMIFPCSLPNRSGQYLVGNTCFAALLMSFDDGNSWQWSEPIAAQTKTEIGTLPDGIGPEKTSIWEPAVFERQDGSLELLIRNSTTQDNPALDHYARPEQMLLHAVSCDGGKTWSRCRPVEIDTIYSRNFTLSQINARDSILMVMNDWPAGLPQRIPHDRHKLALFFAPGGEVDLMLPGPLVQPESGIAFYPNGFVENNSLYLAYTYPSTIMGAKVTPLPKFDRPFLLPRAGRNGLRFISGQIASLSLKEATLGVVLSEALNMAEKVNFEFTMQLFYRRDEENFPLFSIGGKTRNGLVVEAEYDKEFLADSIVLKTVDGKKYVLENKVKRGEVKFKLILTAKHFEIFVNEHHCILEKKILRKFAFGGLYAQPEWPSGTSMAQDIRVYLDSIKVY